MRIVHLSSVTTCLDKYVGSSYCEHRTETEQSENKFLQKQLSIGQLFLRMQMEVLKWTFGEDL